MFTRSISLFWHYSSRALRAHAIYILLAAIGLTLSISLYCSIRLANETVLREFRGAVDAIVGSSAFQIVGVEGKLEASKILPALHEIRESATLLPVRKDQIRIIDGSNEPREVGLIGVDVLNNQFPDLGGERDDDDQGTGLLSYDLVIAPSSFEEYLVDRKLRVRNYKGEELSVSVRFTDSESGIFKLYGGDVILVDLSLADELLGDYGALTQVNVYPKRGVSVEELKGELAKTLPVGARLIEPERAYKRVARTSEALRMNLTFLTALSLFVAVLLGYQVLSLITLRRQDDFATLVSLGASPKLLAITLLVEASCLGVLGGVFGALLGHFFGTYTVSAVQDTISHLYTPLWERGVSGLESWLFFEAIAVGVFTGILGALSPAQSIFNKPPQHYMARVPSPRDMKLVPFLLVGLALVFFILGGIFSSEKFIATHALAPFVSPSFLSAGTLLLTAPTLLLLSKLASRLTWALSPSTLLALDSLTGRLRDMSVSVGALSLAFGMLIGVSTMISSFRVTFQDWLGHVLQADVFISETDGMKLPSPIREKALTWIQESPEVEGVYSGEQRAYSYDDRKIFLRWADLSVSEEKGTIVFRKKERDPFKAVLSGDGVFLSEPFSKRFKKEVGDSIRLFLGGEEREFSVEAIYQDFSTDLGVVFIDQQVAADLGLQGETGLGISVYLNTESDLAEFMSDFEREFPKQFNVRNRKVLEGQALEIFDNTFKITYVLQFLTLGITSLFLILSLILSVLDRRREQLTFRTIGAPFRFLQLVLTKEALILAGCSIVLGLFLGALLSLVLVYRINVIFFGWTVQLLIPYGSTALFCFGFLALSVLISLLVAYGTLREIPVKVLRYE